MFPKKMKCAGIAMLAVLPSARAQDWTEQALLNLFDQRSPLRRETQAATASAVEAIRARTFWPNPVATYSRETVGFTEFYMAEQQLPLSRRLGYERQAMEPAGESAAARGAARQWDARSSLRVAFSRALAAQLQADVLRASIVDANTILDLLRIREQEGEGSRYDRVRVEREVADIRADLALATARARSERAVLAAHLPPSTQIDSVEGTLSDAPALVSRDEVVRRSLDSRAEIRAESSRLTQLAFERQAAERLRIPEPVVSGGIKRTEVLGNRTDTGVAFGVSIALPFFNKGQAEVARIASEEAQTQARRDVLVQQIAAAVAGACDVYLARLEALRAFERETLDVGADLLRIARVGYQEGEIGILELLDAYRIDRQTALRRLELQAAVKETEIELSRSAGYEVTQ